MVNKRIKYRYERDMSLRNPNELFNDEDEIEEIHEKEKTNPKYQLMLRLQEKRLRIQNTYNVDELRD